MSRRWTLLAGLAIVVAGAAVAFLGFEAPEPEPEPQEVRLPLPDEREIVAHRLPDGTPVMLSRRYGSEVAVFDPRLPESFEDEDLVDVYVMFCQGSRIGMELL